MQQNRFLLYKSIENIEQMLYIVMEKYLFFKIYMISKRGENIQKDELIQFHIFLLQLKNHLEEMIDNNDRLVFQSYKKIDVTPHMIQKSKREHELAVFILSRDIADLLSNNNHSGLEKISNKLGQLSKRIMTEKEKRLIIL